VLGNDLYFYKKTFSVHQNLQPTEEHAAGSRYTYRYIKVLYRFNALHQHIISFHCLYVIEKLICRIVPGVRLSVCTHLKQAPLPVMPINEIEPRYKVGALAFPVPAEDLHDCPCTTLYFDIRCFS